MDRPTVDLSAREFVLAETFLRLPGQVLSRLWGYDFDLGAVCRRGDHGHAVHLAVGARGSGVPVIFVSRAVPAGHRRGATPAPEPVGAEITGAQSTSRSPPRAMARP